jgi:hypothetical protein
MCELTCRCGRPSGGLVVRILFRRAIWLANALARGRPAAGATLGTADGEVFRARRGGRLHVVVAARRLKQPPRRAVCRPLRPRARCVGILRASAPRRALVGRHEQLQRERARNAATPAECMHLLLEPARPPSLTRIAFALAARSQNVSATHSKRSAGGARGGTAAARAPTPRRLRYCACRGALEAARSSRAAARTAEIARTLRLARRAARPSLPRATRAGRAARERPSEYLRAPHRAAGCTGRSARPGSAARAIALERPCQR